MQSGHYYYPTDQQPATTTNTTHPYQPTLHDSGNNDSNAPVIPLSEYLLHVVSLSSHVVSFSSLGHVLTYPPFY